MGWIRLCTACVLTTAVLACLVGESRAEEERHKPLGLDFVVYSYHHGPDKMPAVNILRLGRGDDWRDFQKRGSSVRSRS